MSTSSLRVLRKGIAEQSMLPRDMLVILDAYLARKRPAETEAAASSAAAAASSSSSTTKKKAKRTKRASRTGVARQYHEGEGTPTFYVILSDDGGLKFDTWIEYMGNFMSPRRLFDIEPTGAPDALVTIDNANSDGYFLVDLGDERFPLDASGYSLMLQARQTQENNNNKLASKMGRMRW